MATGGDKQASFALNLEGNVDEVSQEMAAELEQLRKKFASSTDAVKQMSGAMRSLRGTTDQVKQAKSQLKGLIEGERAKISTASLALLKHGTTYGKVTAAQAKQRATQDKIAESMKKATELSRRMHDEQEKAREKARGNSVAAAGGPVAGVGGLLEKLRTSLSTSAGQMALLAGAAVALGAAFYGLGRALVDATTSLIGWIVENANLLRSMQIAREAFTGTAIDATHLGHQLDALAGKVSTPKEELAKLGNELVRTLSGTRVSGQGIVDTFNAVAMASDAMGDTVGAKLQEIITRSKQFGRVQINPLELQGTGLQFKDVAGQLAKQLHIGVAEAQRELFMGRVKVDDAAKALRAAVEARFGKVNAAKMLDLRVQVQKLHEKLTALMSGVDLEPLLRGVAKLFALFDQSTVAGATLKTMLTTIGNQLGPAFEKAVPTISKVFRTIELLALDLLIEVVRVGLGIRAAFQQHPELAELGRRIAQLTVSTNGLGDAIAFTGRYFQVAATMALAFAAGIERVLELVDELKKVGWKDLGNAITQGITGGINGGAGGPVAAIASLGEQLQAKFRAVLGIKSPARAFRLDGRQIPRGTAQGIDDEAPTAQRAVERMAPTPGAPAGRASGAAGRAIAAGRATASVTIVYQGSGASGAAVKAELEDPRFLAKFTKAAEDLAAQMGVPTMTETPT